MNTTKSACLFLFHDRLNFNELEPLFGWSYWFLVSMEVDKGIADKGIAIWQQKNSGCFPRWHIWNACGILQTGIDIHEATNNGFCEVSMLWLYAIACGLFLFNNTLGYFFTGNVSAVQDWLSFYGEPTLKGSSAEIFLLCNNSS